MRSHVVRIGHRQASDGTAANPAPATIADRAPLSIREQRDAMRTDRADDAIRARIARMTAWDRSRDYRAPLSRSAVIARPQGTLLHPATLAFIAGCERDDARGYCDMPTRDYVIVR